ncbi:MAG: alpha/beta hydrolase [Blastocatellia bacterium]|nr:alpha/beta hydrolase [Blastocatellia bacterium]
MNLRQTALLPALALLLAATAQAQPRDNSWPEYATRPGKLVDVGGYRLNYYSFGEGSPTVVMEAGGGWGAVAWARIMPRLAAVTRVISYDRAGMNFSDFGPIERAPEQDVRDLRELLRREKIPGPYLFVGWSAGGMIVRWYASLHPEETAAVITVDGSDFDYWDPQAPNPDWLANAIKRFRDARDAAEQKLFDKDPGLLARSSLMINPLHFYAPMREALAERVKDPRAYAQTLHHLEHMKESNDGLRRVWKHLGPIPLRVLVAGEHVVKNNRDFLDHAYRIAGMSNDGLMIIVPGTTHGMHLDKPDPIVEQINDMVLRIRARRSAAR